MKKLNKKYLWLSGLASVLLLGACSSESTDEVEEPVEAEGSQTDEQVLNVQLDVEVASMDPQIATDGTSFEVIANIIEGLYQTDSDGKAIPALVESAEKGEDGLSYTFKLREDATWSNGDPVTANDFVYAWRRLADPDTGSEYSYIMGIAGLVNANEVLDGEKAPEELGVQATDDYTLEVQLANPVPYFESLMSFIPFFPMNEDFMDEVGDSYGTSPDTLLSNGAFTVSSYEPAATSIELDKNEDYFDADSVVLDGVDYQVIKDSQQAMLSYQNGEVDVVTLAGEQVDLFKDDPEFVNVQAGYLWYISPNTVVEGLENENLRKALATSFDKQQITDTILKDGSVPADYIIPDGLAVGPDGKDFRETSDTYLEFDPEAAKESLEAAKAELGKDTFTFGLVVEDTESAINVSQVLKSQIESNLDGVTIEIEQMPKKTRLELMKQGDYDLGLTRWGPDYADPMTYADLWVTDGNNNDGSWSNAEYDELIASSINGELSLDNEARWEALKETESILMNEAGVLPVYQKGNAVMMQDNVSGFDFHAVGLPRVYKFAVKE
ncbi:MAG: peptide ABC transporter substrate-binding protein [Alkalibacterium sp.]|uniref:ABC transporter substrate-binding protein n=1 Tax=Alkalibacterium gilvum TaxID=1130080 RepID=UPI00264E4317|nr:peptide ABC transporter substrate-binding protein [Alkalibacterium sp.]MDN6398169.1 peptide ABC transporter substrate-binding protein [Alkalibacterium sp.]MDN6730034.1 peptide ABC transporter substrate-binding protein [Alkalibacterium sp.]